MYFGRDNADNVTSRYLTIANGSVGCGNWHVSKFEAHNIKVAGPSVGAAIRMRGAGAMHFQAGLLDSSSIHGIISAETTADGTGCFRTVCTMCTFYTEGDTKAAHAIHVPNDTSPDATFAGLSLLGASFTVSGSVASGRVEYAGFFTPQ